MIVAVVGKGRNCPSELHDLAFTVGHQVALAHTLVTGARGGVMLHAALGAESAHGMIVGLLPADCEPEDGWPESALLLRTGLSTVTRNVVMGSCCDAMVALPGSHGTMQELTVALDRGIPICAIEAPAWCAAFGVDDVALEDLPAWLATR